MWLPELRDMVRFFGRRASALAITHAGRRQICAENAVFSRVTLLSPGICSALVIYSPSTQGIYTTVRYNIIPGIPQVLWYGAACCGSRPAAPPGLLLPLLFEQHRRYRCKNDARPNGERIKRRFPPGEWRGAYSQHAADVIFRAKIRQHSLLFGDGTMLLFLNIFPERRVTVLSTRPCERPGTSFAPSLLVYVPVIQFSDSRSSRSPGCHCFL